MRFSVVLLVLTATIAGSFAKSSRQLDDETATSVYTWADTFDDVAGVMRSALPIVQELMSSSTGARQSDLFRPLVEFLPVLARFLHTSSLIMTAFTGFLRETVVALNADLPALIS